MSRLVRFAPLLLLALLIAVLAWRLAIPPNNDVRSKLEGQRVPEFSIPAAIPGKPGLTSGNLAEGQPRLLNIFASWCVPCVSEARVLGALQREGVPIDGIAVRDRPEDVARFLADHGDPYRRIGSDAQSAVQIALGSSGVPESFVIDGGGVIRYQHIGPIEERDIPAILAKLESAK
jgi:cytochrome c biogenesis protein CcmG/thiol:disulfide interchange protein DsbE